MVDHPGGCPCWNSDACSVSSFIMEGKLYLAFEFHDYKLHVFKKVNQHWWHTYIFFFPLTPFSQRSIMKLSNI